MPGPQGPTGPSGPPSPPTPPPPTPGPTGPQAPPVDASGNAAYQMLAAYLTSLGLGELFSVTPEGLPSGYLWEQFQKGIDTQAELQVVIESTPQWQSRFQTIVQQRALAAQGQPVRVMSVDEVVQYEQTAAQLMRNAGMPEWFYDNYADFTPLMVGQISVAELSDRVDRSLSLARNTSPEVRDAFSEFYGANTDAALAAFFLDPQHTMNSVDRAARSAYTAGTARQLGLRGVGQNVSEAIAGSTLTESAIFQNLTDAAALAPLAVEGFDDASDFTDDDLLSATFLGDSKARGELSRRLASRQAANKEAVGGALLTERGVGVGTA